MILIKNGIQYNYIVEISRVAEHLRNATKRGLLASLTLEEWLDTLVLFQGKCAYCKHKPVEVLEHILPVEAGGGTTQDNCVPAYQSCNRRKWGHVTPDLYDATSLQDAVDRVLRHLATRPTRDIPGLERETKMENAYRENAFARDAITMFGGIDPDDELAEHLPIVRGA